MKTEFQGKITDQPPFEVFMVHLEPGVQIQVSIQVAAHPFQMGQESHVTFQFTDPGGGQGAENGHGVAFVLVPQVLVDPAQQGDGLDIPGPPDIAGDVQQGLQGLRKVRCDDEGLDRGHGFLLDSVGTGGNPSNRGRVKYPVP